MSYSMTQISPKHKRVLFISNGHGEDLNACEVLKALRQKYPDVDAIALPIVGEGNAVVVRRVVVASALELTIHHARR